MADEIEQIQTLGDRLRQARQQRGMTQAEVAEVCGVSEAAVSLWEKGDTKNLRLVYFMRACAYFMIDPWTTVFGPEGDAAQRVPGAPKKFRFRPERL